MPRYTDTCQLCGKPLSEVGICCASGSAGDGWYINGRCPKCCHGEAAIRPKYRCRKCGYSGGIPAHNRPESTEACDYIAGLAT
jgi:hypothetical protein